MPPSPEDNPQEFADPGSDRAIQTLSEDLLGFKSFARNAAKALKARKGRESFVVSLQGPWGNGKSSIKNMILDCLRSEYKDECPYIVEFEPWQYRDSETMFKGFFREIILATAGDDWDSTKRAKLLTKYSGQLSVVASTTHFVGEAVAFVNPIVGKGITTAGKAVSRAATSTKEAAEASKTDKTLLELKDELRASMQKLERPVLVVIDDIDRLYEAEMAQVFQLVKANADFPNFVYLLLFEREIVEKALEKVTPGRGQEYLEKIIQMPITVPILAKGRIQRLLLDEIKNLVKIHDINIFEGELEYVGDLVKHELSPYLKNLRSVRRLVNALDLSLPIFITDRDIDVSLGDLLGLETLRLAQPKAYESLPKNKDLLLGRIHFREKELEIELGVSDPQPVSEDPIFIMLRELVELNPLSEQRDFALLISRLFPDSGVDKLNTNGNNSSDAKRRLPPTRFPVKDTYCFNRYFSFSLSSDDFPEAKVSEFIKKMDSYDWLTAKLSSLSEQGNLHILFSRLSERVSEISDSKTIIFFKLVAHLCDHAHLCDQWTFSSKVWKAYRLSDEANTFFLKRFGAEDSSEKRLSLVTRCLESTEAITFSLQIVNTCVKHYSRGAKIIKVENLPEMENLLERRITNAIQNGRIKKLSDLAAILKVWAGFSPTAAQDWFKNWIKKPNDFLSFFNKTIELLEYQGISKTRIADELAISLSDFKTFARREDLQLVLEQLKPIALSEQDQHIIYIVEESLRILKTEDEAGPSDETPERGDFA